MPSTAAAKISRRQPGFLEFVALMASLMALTALSIDVMLPALPFIRDQFGLDDPNRMQLMVTTYVLGFGAGQIIYGPLSDRFGRKPVLGAGLALYAAASLLCLSSWSFEVLLAARFLQGIGNASPRVVAVAVIRDTYGGRRMAEVMSFVTMVFIIVPALAPAAGAGILLVGDWKMIFAFLGAVSLAIWGWMFFRLAETRPPELREPLSLAWLGRAIKETVTTRQTLGYTIATGCAFGGMMAYINSAQQIYVQTYDAGDMFTVYFGIVAAALAVAAITNSRLVGRLGMRRIGHTAMVGYTLVGIVHLAAASIWSPLPLPAFIGMMMAQLFFFGMIMPNYNSLAMEPMGRIAGTASSFVGATTTAIAATLGWVVGQSYDGTAWPMAAGYAAFGTGGVLLTLLTERGRMFRAGEG